MLSGDEDGQSRVIAAEWDVDPDLLDEAEWELESIDNNDGFTVGYFVRFSEDTDPKLLELLGVPPGMFHREVSVSAFNSPEYNEDEERLPNRQLGAGAAIAGESFVGHTFASPDTARATPEADDDYNLPGGDEDWNEPVAKEDYTRTINRRSDPSPEGEAHLIDETGNFLVYEHGNKLIVTEPFSTSASSNFSNFVFGESTFGGAATNQATRNFQRQLLERIDALEASVKAYKHSLPARGHNNPPELVEPEPISRREIEFVLRVTIEMREEVLQPQPDPLKLSTFASKLLTIAQSIAAWFGRKADLAINAAITWTVPTVAAVRYLPDPQKIQTDLLAVVEASKSLISFIQPGL